MFTSGDTPDGEVVLFLDTEPLLVTETISCETDLQSYGYSYLFLDLAGSGSFS